MKGTGGDQKGSVGRREKASEMDEGQGWTRRDIEVACVVSAAAGLGV